MALLVGAEVGDHDVLHFGNAAKRFEMLKLERLLWGFLSTLRLRRVLLSSLFGRAEFGEGAEGLLEEPESLLVVAL